MKAKLPTTKAKTAYGLLTAITKLIIAEPKRYSQHTFIETKDGPSDVFEIPQFPECGTVGLRRWMGGRAQRARTVPIRLTAKSKMPRLTFSAWIGTNPRNSSTGAHFVIDADADQNRRRSNTHVLASVTFAPSKRPTRLSYSPRRCRP